MGILADGTKNLLFHSSYEDCIDNGHIVYLILLLPVFVGLVAIDVWRLKSVRRDTPLARL